MCSLQGCVCPEGAPLPSVRKLPQMLTMVLSEASVFGAESPASEIEFRSVDWLMAHGDAQPCPTGSPCLPGHVHKFTSRDPVPEPLGHLSGA